MGQEKEGSPIRWQDVHDVGNQAGRDMGTVECVGGWW